MYRYRSTNPGPRTRLPDRSQSHFQVNAEKNYNPYVYVRPPIQNQTRTPGPGHVVQYNPRHIAPAKKSSGSSYFSSLEERCGVRKKPNPRDETQNSRVQSSWNNQKASSSSKTDTTVHPLVNVEEEESSKVENFSQKSITWAKNYNCSLAERPHPATRTYGQSAPQSFSRMPIRSNEPLPMSSGLVLNVINPMVAARIRAEGFEKAAAAFREMKPDINAKSVLSPILEPTVTNQYSTEESDKQKTRNALVEIVTKSQASMLPEKIETYQPGLELAEPEDQPDRASTHVIDALDIPRSSTEFVSKNSNDRESEDEEQTDYYDETYLHRDGTVLLNESENQECNDKDIDYSIEETSPSAQKPETSDPTSQNIIEMFPFESDNETGQNLEFMFRNFTRAPGGYEEDYIRCEDGPMKLVVPRELGTDKEHYMVMAEHLGRAEIHCSPLNLSSSTNESTEYVSEPELVLSPESEIPEIDAKSDENVAKSSEILLPDSFEEADEVETNNDSNSCSSEMLKSNPNDETYVVL